MSEYPHIFEVTNPNEAVIVLDDGREIHVIVELSDGSDNAIVVFIDTPNFEPDGSDGKGGLRVLVNENDDTGGTVPYT